MPQAPTQVRASRKRDAADKLAAHRLSVLELATGDGGAELAVEHPAYGCNRLEPMLSLEGRRVSSITIQKILNDNGLGTRQDYWLALEKANADKALELTAEQAAFPEKLNPCFRERQASCCQPIPSLSAPSREWARCTCTRWWTPTAPTPSGSCTSRSSPRLRWRCCTNDVLPFYRRLKLEVKAVLTDNGREFCGTERHPYELHLDLNGIEHRRTKVRTRWTNGSWSGSRARSSRSSSASPCLRSSTTAWTRYSRTSTLGCVTTTPNGLILGTETRDEGPSKPSISSLGQKVKRTCEPRVPESRKRGG